MYRPPLKAPMTRAESRSHCWDPRLAISTPSERLRGKQWQTGPQFPHPPQENVTCSYCPVH